jgi:hypothetical protein
MRFLYGWSQFPLEFLCDWWHTIAWRGEVCCACLFRSKLRAALAPLVPCYENFARSIPMMDVVMVAIAFAFFAVSIAYAYACERL